MKPVIDVLNDSAVEAVKKSGLAVETARMATVTALGTAGTINVQAGADTFERVRILSGYLSPTVGDVVEIMNTAGGWVCIGKIMGSSAPRIQSGVAIIPSGTVGWRGVRVNFDKAFATTPRVVVTPTYSGSTADTEIETATNNTSTTGFDCRNRRSTTSETTVHWIATDL